MDKLMACDKAKAMQDSMKSAFDTSWKAMEGAPAEARAGMAAGCKATADGIKTTITSMGC
ncbi:MAG: hypothetical protein NT062_03620, partial [Proteobacteria bacterium]|nr:hypothetical protein [Pseudomonadota bacterium]